MGKWADRLRDWLRHGREALDRLRRWYLEPYAPTRGEDAWLQAFLRSVFRRYHFSSDAVGWLGANVRVEVQDRASRRGGGFWIPGERLVRLFTMQDEAAVHELAHAWWHYRRQEQKSALMDAVKRVAQEPDRRYARVQGLAHGYVYGTPHDGWPGLLVDNNDWEMFAGLASGTMGDISLMPPYLRRFYEGLFEGTDRA